jgi:hypothetical protein
LKIQLAYLSKNGRALVQRTVITSAAAFLIALLSGSYVPFIPTVRAAVGPDCSWYDYQSDAQYDLDQVLENYPSIIETFRQLDPDGDGIACPELPQRPPVLESAIRIRGQFDPSYDFVGIEGSGYSAWYDVRLAGVSLDPRANEVARDATCSDLVTNDEIARLFALSGGTARQFYLESATREALPAGDEDGRHSVTASAWTVLNSPATPVLINEWLIRNGLAFVDPDTARGNLRKRLETAQEQAQNDGLGVWGACLIPGELFAPPLQPEGHVTRESGSGDEVIAFSISVEGTYLLTLDVAIERSVFVAVDVYALNGTWIPALSVVTAEGGRFSAAGFLSPGEYYIQVKAVGTWQVTIESMG